MTAWGAVLICRAACTTFTQLVAVRTFLGVLEPGSNPASVIIFGVLYTHAGQPLKMGIWIWLVELRISLVGF